MKIGIAGATGFIGKNLMEWILNESDHEIVALVRSVALTHEARITLRQVDLFSLKDAERGLAGCDVAIYLVRSISPSSRLSQGSIRDMDYILADNFAKAAKDQGVRHILYVGERVSIPAGAPAHISSRSEIESALGAYGTPLTVLRCGLIIGPGSSSFEVLKRMTRLPIAVIPKWAKAPCQSVCLRDVLRLLLNFLEAGPDYASVYEVGVPDPYNFEHLIAELAESAGKRRLYVGVPILAPGLSKWLIRMVTGLPKAQVYPFIESLLTPMMAGVEQVPPVVFIPEWHDIKDAFEYAANPSHKVDRLVRSTGISSLRGNEVRSVQRLPLPVGRDAMWVARAYMKFLPRLFSSFIKVKRRGDVCWFHLAGYARPLLIMHFSRSRSSRDRPLFYITGGVLAKPAPRARFEFRTSPDRTFVMAAIHEYRPSLQWFLYRATQAPIHKWVMKRFGKFLSHQVEC